MSVEQGGIVGNQGCQLLRLTYKSYKYVLTFISLNHLNIKRKPSFICNNDKQI